MKKMTDSAQILKKAYLDFIKKSQKPTKPADNVISLMPKLQEKKRNEEARKK